MSMNETPRIKPEIVAAICAGLGMVLEGDSPELAAAIAAATICVAQGECQAVRFKRTGHVWVTAGRQKIMDSRLYT